MTGADSPVIAGFVDRGDAVDDFAVRRDHVARLDQHDVARRQLVGGGRNGRTGQRVDDQLGQDIDALGAQGVGRRLAATLGDALGEIREQDGEPEP